MSGRVGIVVFPGSNCERDCRRALESLGAQTTFVWHKEVALPDVDIVVLPGGFAHGDYLRTGAIARFSPVMSAVRDHADAGGLVIGICNGFQILCEAGLLPGALRKNSGLKFICRWVGLSVDNNQSPFTARAIPGQRMCIPINHFEGSWHCDSDELERVRANGQVVLRYTANPNGALDDVAGLTNARGNVFGLMPHPERACEPSSGSQDGAVILESMLESVPTREHAHL
ncbi:phosphoribosylformylglycinamidine synthase subunit PurQ [soil metagenome]